MTTEAVHACPGCALILDWRVEYPPIPMTFFTWFDADGRPIEFCPGCDEELPSGDLRRAKVWQARAEGALVFGALVWICLSPWWLGSLWP